MWEKVTVSMFQQLYDILNGQNFSHEVERQIKLLAVMDDRPESYYEDLPLADLKREVKRADFLTIEDMPTAKAPEYVTVDGHKFKVMYEVRDIRAGQFIDVMSSAKDADEHILNLDKTLAAICLPVIDGKVGKYGSMPFMEVADLMARLPIVQASSIADFFYRVWTAFLKATPDCLAKKVKRGEKLTEQEAITLAAAFHSGGDGLTALSRWQSLNASH